MRVRRPALVAAMLAPLLVAGPAMAAPETKHGSCERFGQAFATWARGELDPEAGHPGTGMPVPARTAPGHAANILHAEMTEELEELPGTPFCDAHPQR